MHADAYRLGSRAEVDDLDLDADLDRSVTVVEWGEGLVEDLADSHLEIRITMPPATGGAAAEGGEGGAPGAGAAAEGGEGGAPGAGGGAEGGGGGGAEEGGGGGAEDNTVRAVRLTGRGPRWEAAAESARLALLGGPEPL